MNGFYTALVLAACLTATGCSSSVPEAPAAPIAPSVGAVVPPDATRSTTERVQANESTIQPISKRARAPFLARNLATRKRTANAKHIKTASAAENRSVMAPRSEFNDDAEDLKVSAVAKVAKDEDACLSTKHGHAEFLRSDLAYSITGIDCQGDLPAQ